MHHIRFIFVSNKFKVAEYTQLTSIWIFPILSSFMWCNTLKRMWRWQSRAPSQSKVSTHPRPGPLVSGWNKTMISVGCLLHKAIADAWVRLSSPCLQNSVTNSLWQWSPYHWPSRGVGCFQPTAGVQKANTWRLKTRLLWVDGAQQLGKAIHLGEGRLWSQTRADVTR
jgi:hypothetical protein